MNKVESTNKTRRMPLQEQVEREVRQWIEVGKYDSGDQLPAAREIAELCGGIKEQTVRRALKTLMQEGLLEGAQGKGIFVTKIGAKHKRIALVLPNLEDELTIQIAKGARQVLDENGFHAVILDAHRDSAKEHANIAGLEDLPVDGAIIFPIAYSDMSERILRLKMDRFPLVLVDKYFAGVEVDCVLADDYGGSYALTCALLDRGYGKIAWVGGEEGSTSVENRLEGFRWAMGDRGLPVSRAMVRRLHLSTPTSLFKERLVEEVDALLALSDRPRAVLCANDLIALEVIANLTKRGLTIPGNIAVAGFDDLREARSSQPGLTTVKKPIESMGANAAELLLQRIVKRNSPPQKRVIPTNVIIRESA